MNDTNTGGPAFPSHGSMGEVAHEGMTLRDYFAAKAMQSYLNGDDRDSFTYDEWAKASYQMADAMLKAREA
jgi:hypothetical protein